MKNSLFSGVVHGLRAVFMLIMTAFISGCSGHQVSQYSAKEPKLLPEEYFLGKTKGYGILLGRSGEQKRTFIVEIDGSLDDDVLTLKENFRFDDGELQFREWKIRKVRNHVYVGEAGDVVGEAHGEASGNAFNFRYVLKVKTKESQWNIRFDDWMFLHEDGVLVNKAVMSKFGFRVGEVLLVFRKN